jgi:mannose-6-phosphate isomerase-like protein (cupin superfamily)
MIDNPDLCVVRTRAGERISAELAAVLDPIDPTSFHEYVLPAANFVELHQQDVDEFWWFTQGDPIVTLWTESSGSREYQLYPGDMVVCPRGVAHTLRADHDLIYYQFFSVRRPGTRMGHIPVNV